MKKTLLAVAVAAALPAVAFAQSNVTMYGVADFGISKASGGDTQFTSNGTGNNGNSRLGVRGTEDLGGGLKASFNFEQAVNLETGATDAATWQRAAWASLSGGFGSVRFGRSLSPSFYGVAAWELTGTANYSSQFNSFGAVGNTRNNSGIAYTTPNMGGFSATLGYVFEADNGGLGNRVDANVIYGAGPLVVSAWYNKNSLAAEPGMGIGGSYNFGAFKLAGSYQEKANQDSGFSLGVGTKLGPVDLVFDVVRYNQDTTNLNYTNYLVEAKYPLSKRTFVYAAYLVLDISQPTLTTYAFDNKSTSIGIRHNF